MACWHKVVLAETQVLGVLRHVLEFDTGHAELKPQVMDASARFLSFVVDSLAMALSLKTWIKPSKPDKSVPELVVLHELPGSREAVDGDIQETVEDHLAGLDIIARIGGYPNTVAFIRNKLPSNKRVRSGDFGEIIASEYVDQFTDYRVPIKKLRWKDDRSVAMRGNDVIAIKKVEKRFRLLKGESKSRAALSEAAVKEAVDGLAKHAGRPNPCSLAFISSRLREADRHAEAEIFEDFQSKTPKLDQIEHMVFTLSGNNPTTHLKKFADKGATVRRYLVGCVIADHQQFIKSVFENIYAGKRRDSHRSS